MTRSRGRGLVSALVTLVCVLSAGCAAHRFTFPAGSGLPAPDGPSAWTEATQGCRAVGTYSATMFMSARVGAERFPGITVFSGLTDTGSFLLQGRAGLGQRLFDLAGGADPATLVLYREDRYTVGPAMDILEALVGIRLGPERLLAILTGCVTRSDVVIRAAWHDDVLEVDTGDARVFLRWRDGRWQPRASFVDGLEVDFTRIVGGWPQEVNLQTGPGQSPQASLRVILEDVQINVDLNPAAFDLAVPETAVFITLDELRARGPLREQGSGR